MCSIIHCLAEEVAYLLLAVGDVKGSSMTLATSAQVIHRMQLLFVRPDKQTR